MVHNFSFSGTLESANTSNLLIQELLRLQLINHQLMVVILNQLTLLSIMPQDCIRRSTEQLQQEIMKQLLKNIS